MSVFLQMPYSKHSQMKYILFILLILSEFYSFSQNSITGTIISKSRPVEFVAVALQKTKFGTNTNEKGYFELNKIPNGRYTLIVSQMGYETLRKEIQVSNNQVVELSLEIKESANRLEEVVVTGTMKEVSKLESPVPIEIYTPKFFQKNPTPSLFDALQNINGVRPQLNCNVCNTGDIHINGLEGPYTMVLIDGMPIVSSLSTVYGLSGIPNSLVERIEVVKGPASTLYGSEAVGGLINIITKNPNKAASISAEVMATSWKELNTDIGIKYRLSDAVQALAGINYYNYQNPIDKNNDGFTDMTLQNRISIFNKFSFQRTQSRLASLAARLFYEDRWGGETNWTKANRGGSDVYGESIYTKRVELIGMYQLPIKERVMVVVRILKHNTLFDRQLIHTN